MRESILVAAEDLLFDAARNGDIRSVSLDEIAVVVGISRDQLCAYYTSVDAIANDLKRQQIPSQRHVFPDSFRSASKA